MLDMHQRKAEMARLADAFIALPGFISDVSLPHEMLLTKDQEYVSVMFFFKKEFTYIFLLCSSNPCFINFY